MSKGKCATCIYFKMSADPQTKNINKVCYANPPVVSAIAANGGVALIANRAVVNEDDFCRLHEPLPSKILA